MKKALGYSFKIWLGTIFISPLLITIVTSFIHPRPFRDYLSIDFIRYLGLAILIGAILSLPSLFVSAIMVKRITELDQPLRKILTAVFALLLTILPFLFLYLHEGFLTPTDITRMMFCYAITAMILVFIFPLPEN